MRHEHFAWVIFGLIVALVLMVVSACAELFVEECRGKGKPINWHFVVGSLVAIIAIAIALVLAFDFLNNS